MPTSATLLQLCLLGYAIIGTITLAVGAAKLGFLLGLWLTAVELALLAALVYIVLQMLGLLNRYQQTLTALIGVGLLLGTAALPLSIWLRREFAAVNNGTPELPLMLILILVVWNVAAIAHVLRHALSSSYGGAVLYALGYLLLSWGISDWLVPSPAG